MGAEQIIAGECGLSHPKPSPDILPALTLGLLPILLQKSVTSAKNLSTAVLHVHATTCCAQCSNLHVQQEPLIMFRSL